MNRTYLGHMVAMHAAALLAMPAISIHDIPSPAAPSYNRKDNHTRYNPRKQKKTEEQIQKTRATRRRMGR